MGLWNNILGGGAKAGDNAAAALSTTDQNRLLTLIHSKGAAVERIAGEARGQSNRLQQLVDTGKHDIAHQYQGMYARHERDLYAAVTAYDTAALEYASRGGPQLSAESRALIEAVKREAEAMPALDVLKPAADTALTKRVTEITGLPFQRPGVRNIAESYVLQEISGAVAAAGTGASLASKVRPAQAGLAQDIAQQASQGVGRQPIAVPAPVDDDIASLVPMGTPQRPITVTPQGSSIAAAVPRPSGNLGRPDPAATARPTGIGRLNPMEFAAEPSLKEQYAMTGPDINAQIEARLAKAQRDAANGKVAPPVINLDDIVDDGQSAWF